MKEKSTLSSVRKTHIASGKVIISNHQSFFSHCVVFEKEKDFDLGIIDNIKLQCSVFAKVQIWKNFIEQFYEREIFRKDNIT